MAISIGFMAVPVILSAVLAYFVGKYLRIVFLINKFPGPPEYPIINSMMANFTPRGMYYMSACRCCFCYQMGEASLQNQLNKDS